MPAYDFKNSKTGEVIELLLKISEYDEFVKNNPHMERYHTGASAALGDPILLGFKKPDDAFRDRLRDIKANHRRSVINTF